jgi:hypothetical protein
MRTRTSAASVALRKHHPLPTRLAGDDAPAGLRILLDGDAPDGDLELFLDLVLDGAGAVPVREREAAVDLGRFRVLRGAKA